MSLELKDRKILLKLVKNMQKQLDSTKRLETKKRAYKALKDSYNISKTKFQNMIKNENNEYSTVMLKNYKLLLGGVLKHVNTYNTDLWKYYKVKNADIERIAKILGVENET